ncbi:MAG: cupin domain-containing protein [Calditrichia bacterium]
MKIEIQKNPSESKLNELGVKNWPIWEKEVSEFPWHYDQTETCFILEGKVIVTPEKGDPVEIEAGDLVTFPRGMSCTWKILKPIRKHYTFG